MTKLRHEVLKMFCNYTQIFLKTAENYEFSHILDELVGIYNSTAVKKLTINFHE